MTFTATLRAERDASPVDPPRHASRFAGSGSAETLLSANKGIRRIMRLGAATILLKRKPCRGGGGGGGGGVARGFSSDAISAAAQQGIPPPSLRAGRTARRGLDAPAQGSLGLGKCVPLVHPDAPCSNTLLFRCTQTVRCTHASLLRAIVCLSTQETHALVYLIPEHTQH